MVVEGRERGEKREKEEKQIWDKGRDKIFGIYDDKEKVTKDTQEKRERYGGNGRRRKRKREGNK